MRQAISNAAFPLVVEDYLDFLRAGGRVTRSTWNAWSTDGRAAAIEAGQQFRAETQEQLVAMLTGAAATALIRSGEKRTLGAAAAEAVHAEAGGE